MARAKKTQEGKQEHVQPNGQLKALEAFKELAADHAKKAQVWKNAAEAREVRLQDLVKVHVNKPFDDEAAATVSKEAARAVETEALALETKQKAKKAVDSAWETVRQFENESPIRRLIPDEEPAADPDEAKDDE